MELKLLPTGNEESTYESFKLGRRLSKPDVEVECLDVGRVKSELKDTVVVVADGVDDKKMRP
jgi:hypothetical protein